jgi:hypothetical protein
MNSTLYAHVSKSNESQDPEGHPTVHECAPVSIMLSKVNSTIDYTMTKNKALYRMMPTAYTGTAGIARGSSDMVKAYMGMETGSPKNEKRQVKMIPLLAQESPMQVNRANENTLLLFADRPGAERC